MFDGRNTENTGCKLESLVAPAQTALAYSTSHSEPPGYPLRRVDSYLVEDIAATRKPSNT